MIRHKRITVVALWGVFVSVGACTHAQGRPSGLPPGEGGQSAGAKLWSNRCVRCHVMRAPGTHSDAEWEVITLHMRVRANLLPREEESILLFLKAAN
jgi:hypothetical protein